MKIRIFYVLALVLSSFSFPSLVEAGDGRDHNNLHNLAISMHNAGEVTLLGSFTIDDLDSFLRPSNEYPWQVGIRVSRGGCHYCWGDVVSVSFSLNGDLDPFLVNAPGDDNFNGVEHLSLNYVEIKGSFNRVEGDSADGVLTLYFTNLHNFTNLHHTLDDGDLDLFLVNAPGGDNSVRFGGVLTAAHVPEPSTLAFVLIAVLFVPFRTRGVQKRSSL